MGSDDEGSDDERLSQKKEAAHQAYRETHPKTQYSTAREAAKALQHLKRANIGSEREPANDRLEAYYDCNDGCYYLGHLKK